MDKLDKIHNLNKYKGNLVKWWNVKDTTAEETVVIGDPTEEIQDFGTPDAINVIEGFDEAGKAVCEEIMNRNKHEDVFEKALNQQKIDEANEIYERLMAEAAYDEAQKQAQIEAAKLGQV